MMNIPFTFSNSATNKQIVQAQEETDHSVYENILSDSIIGLEPDEDSSWLSQLFSQENLGRFALSSQIPLLKNYANPSSTVSVMNINGYKGKKMNEENIINTYHTGKPLVLIYHTHATESFYNKKNQKSYRSTDSHKNVCAVGDAISQVLKDDYNIQVIHDTTLYDYPSYNAAYDNSMEGVQNILKKYPTIKYIFDVHRDGLPNTESARKKYKITIGGMASSKVMIVLGTNHANSKYNKAFAKKVKKQADGMFNGLTLPILDRTEYRYNQFLCKNGILLEFGSNLSTLAEVKNSGTLMGKVIGEVIQKDQKK